jgi:hypothetical protein
MVNSTPLCKESPARPKPVFGEETAGDGSMVSILRDEIAGQSAEVQRAIFAALSGSLRQSGLGSAEFAAALMLRTWPISRKPSIPRLSCQLM